jgi:hypothetical protein
MVVVGTKSKGQERQVKQERPERPERKTRKERLEGQEKLASQAKPGRHWRYEENERKVTLLPGTKRSEILSSQGTDTCKDEDFSYRLLQTICEEQHFDATRMHSAIPIM